MKGKPAWVSIKDKPVLIQFLKTLPLYHPHSYIALHSQFTHSVTVRAGCDRTSHS